MNAMQEKLFLELRKTELEIKHSLKNRNENDWLTPILEDELQDTKDTLEKLKSGNYGLCEMSGELLPEDILKMLPTAKSTEDSKSLDRFCKKSIFPVS